jgi:hypothetical protein
MQAAQKGKKWSVGVREYWSIGFLNTSLHYSTTPVLQPFQYEAYEAFSVAC